MLLEVWEFLTHLGFLESMKTGNELTICDGISGSVVHLCN